MPTFLRRTLCFALLGMALNAPQPALAATVVSEGQDFATDVLGAPWDMSNQEDVFPLLWAHNLSSANVAGGIMTAQAINSDPHFWLHFPQIASSILPINSQQKLIDANKYNRLSVYMWLPDSIVPGANTGRVVWHHGGDTGAQFDAAYSESTLFPVYPGWHLYTFDLSKLQTTKGIAWSGTMQGLRIDPCLNCVISFKIDWARLWNGNDTQAQVPTLASGKTRLLVDSDTSTDNGSLGVYPANSQGQVLLGGLPPGRYYTAALSDEDYALAERGDAWDMNSTSDFVWTLTSGFRNPSVANKTFTGTTNGADPYVLLDIPADHPIDASKYKYLTLEMTLDRLPTLESGLLLWWGTEPVAVKDRTDFIPVQGGKNTYTIDLSRYPSWNGNIKALRLDPLNGPNANSGVGVTLHSIRLTKTQGGSESVQFAADPLVINGKPRASIVAPTYDTGEDYATSELGKPWVMDSGDVLKPELSNLSGWEYITSIPDLGLSGKFFHGASLPAAPGATEGDPQAFLAFQQNAKPIQADNYRLFGFSIYVPFNSLDLNELTTGAMMRVVWKENDTDAGLQSDDIVLMPGYNTYWLDMKAIRYQPETTRSWGGQVRYLRIDPLEFPTSRHFYLGPAKLTAYPKARRFLPVIVDLSDPDNDPVTVEVWAGSSKLASASGKRGRTTVLTDVSSLPSGIHTLSLKLSDGINSNTVALPVPFEKLPLTTPPSSYEMAAANRIFNWVEGTLPELAPKGPQSTTTHSCVLPESYVRLYSGTGLCLMVSDGAGFFTLGNVSDYAGPLKDLLDTAAAAGF
jgi:hypothetical protein